MTTPEKFTQDLRSIIAESGDTYSPFTGYPSKSIHSPIIYRMFGPDCGFCPNIILKDDNGAEYFVYSVDWKHNFAVVGLIPVPSSEPVNEPE